MGTIQISFTNTVTEQNEVTFVRESEAGLLLIGIRPFILATYQPPDSTSAYPFQATLARPVLIQELGLPTRPIRYQVEAQYGRYIDERGITQHVLLPVPGVSLRQQVSDAVFEKIMLLIIEHKLPPTVAFKVIEQLYNCPFAEKFSEKENSLICSGDEHRADNNHGTDRRFSPAVGRDETDGLAGDFGPPSETAWLARRAELGLDRRHLAGAYLVAGGSS